MKLEKLAKEAIPRWFRAAFQARRWRTQRARSFAGPPAAGHPSAGHPLGEHPEEPVVIPGQERRNILFITVDQQRFDALGVNGGTVARTPNLDQLAKGGINYHRAHVQNVVCMPSRATMLSGLHPFSHGVVANGIQLPASTPSVAEHLRRAGYRTALIGKAHFDPHLDLSLRYFENRCAAESLSGPWHGFEHLAFAAHGPMGGHHYAAWLWDHFPEDVAGFAAALTGVGGGDTDAPEAVSYTHLTLPTILRV